MRLAWGGGLRNVEFRFSDQRYLGFFKLTPPLLGYLKGVRHESDEEVEKDEDQLRVFFDRCYASDRSNGTYTKVLKSTLEARKAKDLREKGIAVELKPTARRRYQGTSDRIRST